MGTDDRLQALVLAMIRKNGLSKPKLRCSAAVHLVERRRGGRSDQNSSTASAQLLLVAVRGVDLPITCTLDIFIALRGSFGRAGDC